MKVNTSAQLQSYGMDQPTLPILVRQFSKGIWSTEQGCAPAEMPVMLTVNGEPWLDFLCTPEHLDGLAVGFLYNEGLIDNAAGIAQVRVCPAGDNVDVWTNHALEKPIRWRKISGCTGGVTSTGYDWESDTSGLAARLLSSPIQFEEVALTAPQVSELIFGLFHAQKLHRQSGGLHASAISDGKQLFLSCEDIGSHNTLDKLAGRVILENINEPRQVILTTGRISSEMVQKAFRLGATFIISHTAPSSLAVQMADRWGITLIGYARDERFSVYAHPERILSC